MRERPAGPGADAFTAYSYRVTHGCFGSLCYGGQGDLGWKGTAYSGGCRERIERGPYELYAAFRGCCDVVDGGYTKIEGLLLPGNNGRKIPGDLFLDQRYAGSHIRLLERHGLVGVPDKVSQPAYGEQVQQPEDDQDGFLLTFHGYEYSMEELG